MQPSYSLSASMVAHIRIHICVHALVHILVIVVFAVDTGTLNGTDLVPVSPVVVTVEGTAVEYAAKLFSEWEKVGRYVYTYLRVCVYTCLSFFSYLLLCWCFG